MSFTGFVQVLGLLEKCLIEKSILRALEKSLKMQNLVKDLEKCLKNHTKPCGQKRKASTILVITDQMSLESANFMKSIH